MNTIANSLKLLSAKGCAAMYPLKDDFADFQASPSIAKRNKLAEANMGLVRMVAHKIAKYSFLPYEDLEQVGFVTLIGCVERFNPSKGYSFSTFALPILRGRILNYLRDKGHAIKIPRQHYDLIQKAKHFNSKFLEQNGRAPTDAEIAAGIDISLEKYRQSQMALLRCRYLDSDSEIGETPEAMPSNFSDTDNLSLMPDLDSCTDRERQALELLFLEGESYTRTAKAMKCKGDDLIALLRQGLSRMAIVESGSTTVVSHSPNMPNDRQFAYKQLLACGMSRNSAIRLLEPASSVE